jgi:ribonuclease III
MPAPLEELERRTGYQFRDPALLRRALTHKSYSSDNGVGPFSPLDDNEQLEFLGDAILGFVASDDLYHAYPTFPEGKLSRLKGHVVSAVHLAVAARTLDLGEYLLLGRGEELNSGRSKPALLANALEALIAAIYLDGGLGPSRAFIKRCVFARPADAGTELAPIPLDAKSELQELAQALRLPVPRYVIVHEKGPEHAKTFTVEARVGKDHSAKGEGSSKKVASQRAAEALLDTIRALAQEPPAPVA